MGFLGLLIPPQYRLAIEIGALVIYTGVTVHVTSTFINNKWEAAQAQQIKEAAILKGELEKQVSDLKDTLAQSAQQTEVHKREALQKIDTLESTLRTTVATRGLRDPGRLQRRSCPSDTTGQGRVSTEPSQGLSGEDDHPELSARLSEFLLREFNAADKVVVDREECYERYETIIDQVNAYADRVQNIKH